jgi:hypothetical protein
MPSVSCPPTPSSHPPHLNPLEALHSTMHISSGGINPPTQTPTQHLNSRSQAFIKLLPPLEDVVLAADLRGNVQILTFEGWGATHAQVGFMGWR